MAGKVSIDFQNDCWWFRLYGDKGQMIDIWEVGTGDVTVMFAAYQKLYLIEPKKEG